MCECVIHAFFSFFAHSRLFVMIYVLTYIKHKVLNCPIGQSVDITSFTVLYYMCFMIVLLISSASSHISPIYLLLILTTLIGTCILYK